MKVLNVNKGRFAACLHWVLLVLFTQTIADGANHFRNQISISTNLRHHFDTKGFSTWQIGDKFTPRLSIHYSRWLNDQWRAYAQVNDFYDDYYESLERAQMLRRTYFLPQLGIERQVFTHGTHSVFLGGGLNYRHGSESIYLETYAGSVSWLTNTLRDFGTHLQVKYQLDVKQHWALLTSCDFNYYFYRDNRASFPVEWNDGSTQYLLKCHVGVGYKF